MADLEQDQFRRRSRRVQDADRDTIIWLVGGAILFITPIAIYRIFNLGQAQPNPAQIMTDQVRRPTARMRRVGKL